MKGRIEKVKKLKEIQLHYSDGSIIAVPENKTLSVGAAFIKTLGKGAIDWRIIRGTQPTLSQKIRGWFAV